MKPKKKDQEKKPYRKPAVRSLGQVKAKLGSFLDKDHSFYGTSFSEDHYHD